MLNRDDLGGMLTTSENLTGVLHDKTSIVKGVLNQNENLRGIIDEENTLNGSLVISNSLSGLLGAPLGEYSTDYNDLDNKPQINGVTLQGNKSTSDLGLFSGDYNDLTNKPTIPDELNDLSDVDVSYNPLNTADMLTYNAALNKWINLPLDAIEIPRVYAPGKVLQVVSNVIPSSSILGVESLSYNDLIDKPTIPAAQVNSDWNAVSGVAEILNKPTLATVATTGSYNDLIDKPTIGGLIPYRDVETQIGTWLDGVTPVYQKYIDLNGLKTLQPNTNTNLASLPGDILLLGGGCIRIDSTYTGYFPYIQLVANGTYLQGNNIRSTSVGVNAVLIQYVYRS